MNTFEHDGFTFELTDEGPIHGETIVLLHGFPETRQSWKDVTPLLTQAGYRVLAPDQRGYSPGARPKSRRDYTLTKLGNDIVAMADAAGVDAFHVVGHDWGGGVAWELAANHPHRVKTVTSLATPHPQALVKAVTRSTQGLKSWYMLFFQLPFVPERGFTIGKRRMRRSLTASGLPEEYVDQYLAVLGEKGAARGALNWYRAVPFGSPNNVGPIALPAMYVYGTDDFALGRTAADLTADYCKGAYRYEVLEGVSHWIPEEVPEIVASLVLDFVTG
jgi:pimeloyl-ACP methyl ester carboxylesterase